MLRDTVFLLLPFFSGMKHTIRDLQAIHQPNTIRPATRQWLADDNSNLLTANRPKPMETKQWLST